MRPTMSDHVGIKVRPGRDRTEEIAHGSCEVCSNCPSQLSLLLVDHSVKLVDIISLNLIGRLIQMIIPNPCLGWNSLIALLQTFKILIPYCKEPCAPINPQVWSVFFTVLVC